MGDTFGELAKGAKLVEFKTAAAAAAIAEHSIAHTYAPAAGRPDAQDEECLKAYAGKIWEKLSREECPAPAIPGNRPYKKRGAMEMIPQANEGCTKCGLCAEKCPVQAIDRNDPHIVNREQCIYCMRCISVCPLSVRKINPAAVQKVALMLQTVSPARRECELFL